MPDPLASGTKIVIKLRDGWRVLQEDLCSPEEILGHHPEREPHEAALLPLARTVGALLAHATPSREPRPDCSEPYPTDYDYYPNDADCIEVNYYKHQLRRYSDDRFVSNFNFADGQPYTIDESEEYQLNYENNNADSPQQVYSPVYGANDGLRVRGPYYQKNRVQFVQPFYKDRVLQCNNFEIYDTDEVDFPILAQEEDVQRYDRGKMNLDIQDNLNRDLKIETESVKEDKDRLFYTCLCLGTFFVSTILLILYPL